MKLRWSHAPKAPRSMGRDALTVLLPLHVPTPTKSTRMSAIYRVYLTLGFQWGLADADTDTWKPPEGIDAQDVAEGQLASGWDVAVNGPGQWSNTCSDFVVSIYRTPYILWLKIERWTLNEIDVAHRTCEATKKLCAVYAVWMCEWRAYSDGRQSTHSRPRYKIRLAGSYTKV